MRLPTKLAIIAIGLALGACGSPEKNADETEKLERRVAELEAALAEERTGESADAAAADAAGPRARSEGTDAAPTSSRPRARAAAAPPSAPESGAPETLGREPSEEAPVSSIETEEAPVPEALPAPQEIETEPVVPRPDPEPEPLEIPGGTELTLVLETPLSSTDSKPGDLVVAKVERAVDDTGAIALPGATYVEGRVLEVRASGRVKGRARVVAAFDRIVLRGESRRLETTPIVVEAEGGGKRDAKIIAGSTAAGAVLGAVLGGKSGAGKGAILGGGAGAGAVLATKGEEVDLPSGSRWTVQVREGGSY